MMTHSKRRPAMLLAGAFLCACVGAGQALAQTFKGGPHIHADVDLSSDGHNNGPYVWKNVQLVGGGFVTGIIGHPRERNLRYARTDIGGAYRWDECRHRWVPLTDFIGINDVNYLGIESIGLDPNDPDRLYLATGTYTESFEGNGAMLLSDDRGFSFKTVPLPIKLGSNDAGRFAGERLGVDPHQGKIIYFGSRLNGLWKSTDRGNTWAHVTSFPVTGSTGTAGDPGVGVIFEQFEPDSGTTVGGATKTFYVGVSDPGTGLYVTNDGGVTFSAVPGQPTGFYPNSVSQDAAGNLYIAYGVSLYGNSVGPYAMTNGAIWKYTLPSATNPGGLWTNISPPKPSYYNWGYGGVAVDPHNANNIIVSTMDRYYPPPQDDLYRSSDGGQTWVSIDQNAYRDVSLSPWILFGAPTAVGAGNWANHLWIDPFDSNHLLYGTGGTIQETFDLSDANTVPGTPGTIVAGGATEWQIGALGIEETAIQTLISPPSGPAHLLSGMYDIGGFTHLDLNHSPAGGMFTNPLQIDVLSLDFAQSLPLDIVRVGNSASGVYGATSTDGGTTWTPFASEPPGVSNGEGTVAIAADASSIVWAPADYGLTGYYSTDGGTTWTAATGLPTEQGNQMTVLSDRFNPKKFFVYEPVGGGLYTSTDGGKTFILTATLSTYGTLKISPGGEGFLWFASSAGLQTSTDSGVSFTAVPGIQQAYTVGFGKAKPGNNAPTVFLYGQINNVSGVFRSTDTGTTWSEITDPQHQFGYIYQVTGDARVYGRVFLGTNGRGIVWGDPK